MSARIYFLMYINPSVIKVWIFCQWCQDTNHTNFLSYPMKWTLATHYHDHFPHLCHAMCCDHGAGRDAIVLHHGTCRFQMFIELYPYLGRKTLSCSAAEPQPPTLFSVREGRPCGHAQFLLTVLNLVVTARHYLVGQKQAWWRSW